MLAVIMKIVSILGIILLVLLCILAALLLIVLFIPIVYRLDAEKDTGSIRADFKLRWLFGLLRAGYSYPEPGRMIVKFLWFTVFDSGKKTEKTKDAKAKDKKTAAGTEVKDCAVETDSSERDSEEKDSAEIHPATASEQETDGATDENTSVHAESSENEKKTLREKLFAKYEKIKYTIIHIYDKIKHIWGNLSFYKKLLQDEETRLLFSHTCGRLGKILRHIRPRQVEADVTFGTGSPDTTGYAYAVYGMLSPHLGKDVCITPDFTQAILEGHLHAAGHITVFTLLINLLAVLLDRRLRLFIRRIKAHSNKTNPATGSKAAAT